MTLDKEVQDTLVTGLRAGRREAFERLYDALHVRIYAYVARLTGDREEAADITQEVFLEAFRRIPTYRGEVRLEPWLYRVATNTAIDHLRRRGKRASEPLDEEEGLAGPHDAYDAYQQSETATLIGAALMGMSDRYRAALVLKDLHGLDNREVASALGVSRGAADVVLFRARSAFKKTYATLAEDAGSSAAARVAGIAALLPPLVIPAGLEAPPAIPQIATATAVPVELPLSIAGSLIAKLTGSVVAKAVAVTAAGVVVGGGVLVGIEALPPGSGGNGVVAVRPETPQSVVAIASTSAAGDQAVHRAQVARRVQARHDEGGPQHQGEGNGPGGMVAGDTAGNGPGGSGSGGGAGSGNTGGPVDVHQGGDQSHGAVTAGAAAGVGGGSVIGGADSGTAGDGDGSGQSGGDAGSLGDGEPARPSGPAGP